jgi:hypothetical protein
MDKLRMEFFKKLVKNSTQEMILDKLRDAFYKKLVKNSIK